MESQIFRLRTKNSSSKDIIGTPNDVKKIHPDKPCHKPSETALTSFSASTYSGILNCIFLFLFTAIAAQLLENYKTYGLLIDSGRWWFLLSGCHYGILEYPLVYFLLYFFVPASICLLLEQSIAKNKIPENIGIKVHILNLIHIILVPIVVIPQIYSNFSVAGSAYVTILYTSLFLKLWSYIQINYWCRKYITSQATLTNKVVSSDSNAEKGFQVHYPDNLTWKGMVYFFFAPTLSYELNFPRTDRIRKRFVLRCLLEIICLMPLVLCVGQQWLAPYVNEYILCYFNNGHFLNKTEYMLKAVIPMNLIWLMSFYMFFQSYLNMLAELLYFADRTFYQDWWNATNMEVHWRKWNTRCHMWALRHIYIPLTELGYSKHVGKLAVWFVSGFFHEYVLCLSLNMFDLGYLISLLFQGHFATFTRVLQKYVGLRWANLLMISVNALGNPGFIMVTCYQYAISNNLDPTVMQT